MMTVREFDLRPWVLGVSVFLSVMVCCTQAMGQEAGTALRMPCALKFECVDAVQFRNAEVRWRLSVDPKRPALYDIVHWRIAYYGRAGQAGPVEYVAQMTFPHGRPPTYRILQHVKVRDWRKLWLGRRWDWREFRRETPAYRDAARSLMRVLFTANKLRHGADPAEMDF